MRLHSIALMMLSLAACTPSQTAPTPHDDRGAAAAVAPVSAPQRTETELVTQVSFSEEGPCTPSLHPELAGQTQVRLTYVKWPHFFEKFCSADLAAHLRKTSAKEVPVTVSFDAKSGGHALCDIAGIAGKRLERGCSFEGVLSGGDSSGGGYESKDGVQLTDADLPPWSPRGRR